MFKNLISSFPIEVFTSKFLSTFEISIENGIVTTEYSYQDGVQYRLVVTDSVVMISDDQIDKNQFIIPNT